ncbi:MAG: hypothetical protein GXX79_21895 [Actinomycetales bacterium]|nr:hypothetical protein [Actinomycetales bacterium]
MSPADRRTPPPAGPVRADDWFAAPERPGHTAPEAVREQVRETDAQAPLPGWGRPAERSRPVDPAPTRWAPAPDPEPTGWANAPGLAPAPAPEPEPTGWAQPPARGTWEGQPPRSGPLSGPFSGRSSPPGPGSRLTPLTRAAAVVGETVRRVPPRIALAVLGVLVVGYVGTAWVVTRSVPDGTSVAGVQIGGLGEDEALARVRAAVGDAGSSAIPLRVGDKTAELDPTAAGLTFDPIRVVDRLAGFTLDPRAVLRHLGGGGAVDTGIDENALRAALDTVAGSTEVKARDATVAFRRAEPVLVAAVEGRRLDVPAASALLGDAWLTRTRPVELPVVSTRPRVGTETARKALDETATPAVAGPLTLAVETRTVVLEPQQFAPALSMKPTGDTLGLSVDARTLRKAALGVDEDIEVPAKDARIVLRDGAPVVLPSAAGERMDLTKLPKAVVTALAAGGDRKAVVPSVAAQPKLSTAKAEALGVRTRVSTFATNLNDNAGRTENLRIAAATVNGTLVLPGETFSLNEVLGERTPEKGYNEAPVINKGRLTIGYGGGVSQMATTIFNNVFFAGLQDVYHKPHSFYISRYPEGREATVNYPTVDLKWKNDSRYGVLVQAWVDSQVHVSFWSTKVWDIKSIKSERTNPREPETIYDESEDCVEQAPNPGFDVTVTRVFLKNGAEVKRQAFHTTYIPEDEVICGPDPSKTPGATPRPNGG